MGDVSDKAAKLARAREVFLTSGELNDAEVRKAILASWRRSQFWGVAVDQVELPYRDDVDDEKRLVSAARPVLDRLERKLADVRMSIILTASQAWVLDRRAGERSLNAYLDKILLAPGFSYAEKFIGTNGIGTALEEKRAYHVFGHEHFVDRLHAVSCAGAPIRDPLSGRVVGAIDVTCWRADASLLMRVLVEEAAHDIEGRLFEQSCERERALLQEFLAACQRTSRPVLSLSDDLTIANVSAAHLLDPDDQTILREKVGELTGSSRETTGEVVLSGGQPARLRCRPVISHSGIAGTVVEIHLTEDRGSRHAGTPAPRVAPLPGIAGRSLAWARVCQEVDTPCRERSWLLLVGEPGVGKVALAKAAHRQSFPSAHLSVVDAADCQADPEGWLAELRGQLQDAGGTVVLHHIGDVSELVPVLIARYAPRSKVECGPEAMQTLLRRDWPGNVAELERVLRATLARRRSGRIGPEDLPEEVHSTIRRVLTPWESFERDVIARALIVAEGDRAVAAAQLGISRATIYRKIHAYGIVIDGPDK